MINSDKASISLKFTIEFNKIASEIEEAYIAVGMITDFMFDFALRNVKNCNTLKIITGIHMPTPPSVLIKLKEITDNNKIFSGVFTNKYFHPKLYLFKLKNGWVGFVGSGNFTNGGWKENEELFIKVTEENICASLLAKFYEWEKDSLEISENLIALYQQSFTSIRNLEREKRKSISNLLDNLTNKFNIENIDFRGHFFVKEDHLAFQSGKTHLDTPEILAERTIVRNKLYRLHDLLTKSIPKSWNIYSHYDPQHIVSHIETKNHDEYNVRSLWVGFGRNKSELKKYGNVDSTPLKFMRMQVIVEYDKVGVWIMPGKAGAGIIDRTHLLSNIVKDNYLDKIFNLLTSLGKNYWIEVANEINSTDSFKTAKELKDFILKDDWRTCYLIIGRNYELGSTELLEDKIVQTCLNDFLKYLPIYELIKDKSLTSV